MFGALEGESGDANVHIEDKEGRKEVMVQVPPGLEDDSESEVEMEELVDSDSDKEDEEMEEWLSKLGMKKIAGGEVVIVSGETRRKRSSGRRRW